MNYQLGDKMFQSEKTKCKKPKDGLDVEKLKDIDVLATVLGGGKITKASALIARDVLNRYECIHEIPALTFSELADIDGVGEKGARAIIASMELSKRAFLGNTNRNRKVNNSTVICELFKPLLNAEKAEVFYALLKNSRLDMIKAVMIARGSLSASIVHPWEAYLPAVKYSASGVIFLHNHPSGDPSPSQEDVKLTNRLNEAGAILGIPMLDHIIIGQNDYFSFADSGVFYERDLLISPIVNPFSLQCLKTRESLTTSN